MGVSKIKVKFPDGTIKYGFYENTVDVAYSKLISDEHAFEKVYEQDRIPISEMTQKVNESDEVYDVHLFVDYGPGMYWDAKATKTALVDNLEPMKFTESVGYFPANCETDYVCEHGIPDWAQ